MHEGAGDDPELRWVVGDDLIDIDDLAAAFFKANDQRGGMSRRTLWLAVATYLCLVPAAVFVRGPGMTRLLVIGTTFGLIILWLFASRKRMLAKRLRAIPAASAAYTCVLDARGVHENAESSSSDRAWSRYQGAFLVDRYLVLVCDTNELRLLPFAGLTEGTLSEPTDVLAQVERWIGVNNEAIP